MHKFIMRNLASRHIGRLVSADLLSGGKLYRKATDDQITSYCTGIGTTRTRGIIQMAGVLRA